MNKEDAVAISLGLRDGDPDPGISQPHPPGSLIAPDSDAIPAPPVTPVTRSPSVSTISTLSDFTAADASDDEFPIDPTAITRHETFYLDDGNVEVFCENTLFRTRTSILSFHSSALGRMFS